MITTELLPLPHNEAVVAVALAKQEGANIKPLNGVAAVVAATVVIVVVVAPASWKPIILV